MPIAPPLIVPSAVHWHWIILWEISFDEGWFVSIIWITAALTRYLTDPTDVTWARLADLTPQRVTRTILTGLGWIACAGLIATWFHTPDGAFAAIAWAFWTGLTWPRTDPPPSGR
jgi:hypothetical protein